MEYLQASGLKLRMCLPSTALLGGEGRIIGWYYTDRDGVVCKATASEVSSAAVLHKLCASHVLDLSYNPFSYVAVAHYASGVCRLLRRDELQLLVREILGLLCHLVQQPYFSRLGDLGEAG